MRTKTIVRGRQREVWDLQVGTEGARSSGVQKVVGSVRCGLSGAKRGLEGFWSLHGFEAIGVECLVSGV